MINYIDKKIRDGRKLSFVSTCESCSHKDICQHSKDYLYFTQAVDEAINRLIYTCGVKDILFSDDRDYRFIKWNFCKFFKF